MIGLTQRAEDRRLGRMEAALFSSRQDGQAALKDKRSSFQPLINNNKYGRESHVHTREWTLSPQDIYDYVSGSTWVKVRNNNYAEKLLLSTNHKSHKNRIPFLKMEVQVVETSWTTLRSTKLLLLWFRT